MDTPGMKVRHIDNFVEEQALHELIFDGVVVPVSCRLGEENEGWTVVRRALAFERVGAAHHQRALVNLDHIVDHAEQTGLIDDPEIQTRIGEAYAACEAARLLYYRVVDLREKGNPPTPEANISRVSGTGCLRIVAELGHVVYGQEGLREKSGGDDIRRVQSSSVAAGTREVQLDQIALRYLNLPKSR
jgi:alkylation response protein AidB-like acyl-CoA dehydrogenase